MCMAFGSPCEKKSFWCLGRHKKIKKKAFWAFGSPCEQKKIKKKLFGRSGRHVNKKKQCEQMERENRNMQISSRGIKSEWTYGNQKNNNAAVILLLKCI